MQPGLRTALDHPSLTPWLREGTRVLRTASESVVAPEGKLQSPGSAQCLCNKHQLCNPVYLPPPPPPPPHFCNIEAQAELQSTLEQHRFGLHRSGYALGVFNKRMVSPLCPWVLNPTIQPAVFWLWWGIHVCRRPTACVRLHHFVQGT